MITKLYFIFLLTAFPLWAKNHIDIYTCYGNAHEMIIEGRVLEKGYSRAVSHDDRKRDNFWHRLKQLIREFNGVEEHEITAVIDHKNYQVQSDDWGYFEFDLRFAKRFLQGYHSVTLQSEKKRDASCHALVLSDQKALGIISDFDDTVVLSDVTSKKKLFKHILFKNYKQRTAIPGMSQRYRSILEDNTPSRLFFITSSPRQLIDEIDDFLDYHDFPKRVILAKKIQIENGDPLFDSYTYKVGKVENLIRLYPHMIWVLFGDNGEQDPDVYTTIRKKYPQKIKAIYIRDVKSAKISEL
jgi:phosphatidate phosphatase APP1